MTQIRRVVQLVVLAMLLGLPVEALASPAPTPQRYAVGLGALPARGPADAPITIVEWSDFSCRYCNIVRAQLAALEHAYPLQIRWVYRQFPLDEDNTLMQEAAVAAAAQGAFWPMHDRLYGWQGRATRGDMVRLAGELGLDVIAFEAALEMRTYREDVLADFEDALALGVSGTPAFFINGRPILGNRPLSTFVEVIDQELRQSRALASQRPDNANVPVANQYAWLMAQASAGPVAEDAAAPAAAARSYQIGLAPASRRWGAADPSVQIVMWSDLECGFCARQLPVLLDVAAQYPADVGISYRHFPLAMHKHARLAAQAAEEAAAQGAFWSFTQRVLAGGETPSLPVLLAAARAERLDLAAFAAALARGAHEAVIADEIGVARSLGISGTPAMFINGKQYDGALAEGPLRQAIEEARAKTQLARGMSRTDAVMLASLDGASSPLDDSWQFVGQTRAPVGVARVRALVAACHRGDVAAAETLLGGHKSTAREGAMWRTWCQRMASGAQATSVAVP